MRTEQISESIENTNENDENASLGSNEEKSHCSTKGFEERIQSAADCAPTPLRCPLLTPATRRATRRPARGLLPPGLCCGPDRWQSGFSSSLGGAVTPINPTHSNKQVGWGWRIRDTSSPSSSQHSRRWLTTAGEGTRGGSALRSPCSSARSLQNRSRTSPTVPKKSAQSVSRNQTRGPGLGGLHFALPPGPHLTQRPAALPVTRPFKVRVCRPPRPPPR